MFSANYWIFWKKLDIQEITEIFGGPYRICHTRTDNWSVIVSPASGNSLCLISSLKAKLRSPCYHSAVLVYCTACITE